MSLASSDPIDSLIENLDSVLDRLNDPASAPAPGPSVEPAGGARPDPAAPSRRSLAHGSGPLPRAETVACRLSRRYRQALPRIANQREIARYFEYSNHGVEVEEDGLEEIPFGEFLVGAGAVTRFELFRALQLQDQAPRRRLGECVAALGFLSAEQVAEHLRRWNGLDVVVVGPDRA